MMRRTLSVAGLASVVLATGTADAQSKEDLAFADALFHQGVALLKQGDDADACARFAQSKELAPAVGVTLYLADCLQRVGRSASAWREFRSAEALAIERKDKRAALAHRRAEALTSALARVTIHVAPSMADSVRISLDGAAVPRDDWETAIPVDPGSHTVVARSGSQERVFEAFVDANRTTASVEIDPLPDENVVPVAHPAETPHAGATDRDAATEHPAEVAPGSRRVWISVGLATLGAVGIGIGAGFGIAAKSARDESNAGPCDASDHCTASGLSLRHAAINDALASTIAFGAGAAALGASVIFTFAIPHGAKGSNVTVAPAAVAGGAGALVRGAF
jgi:hypothetical protein